MDVYFSEEVVVDIELNDGWELEESERELT